MAVELPSAGIISPSPVRVMQGFAACPSITVAWADGRSALLILDPEYQVPLANAVHLATTGLTLRWVSSTGLVSTAKLPHCDAAIVGELPGSGTISLEASAPDGSSRVIGTVAVEVLALPSSGLSLTSVGLETPATVLFPTYEAPTYFLAGSAALPVGETKTLRVALDVTVPNLNGVGLLLVPDHLVFTSSDPAVVELLPLGRVKGLRDGVTTLGASYAVGGQTLGNVQSQLWVSSSQQTFALGFGLPVDDLGFVLPEGSRSAETVVVGQCFSFKGVAGTVGTQPGATMPTAFARDITATATWSAQGQGLTQTPGSPARFCATSEGEAAVRLCEGGTCANLGILVAPPLTFPTLQVSIPAEIRVPPMPGLQTTCVDFQLTAQFASGNRDVTHSVALRFRESFVGGRSPIYVDYSADGTPRFEQGKLCLVLEPDAAGSSLRVFWGSGQVEVNTLVKVQ